MDPSPTSSPGVADSASAVAASGATGSNLAPQLQLERNRQTLADTTAPAAARSIVFSVGENDIMLGRGVSLIKFAGNVRFRALIRTYMDQYNSTSRHRIKHRVAEDVRQEIRRRNGRFLAPISEEDEQRYGVPPTTQAWYIVSEEVAMDKIKQALRDMRLPSSTAPPPNNAPPTRGESERETARHHEPQDAPTTANNAASLAMPHVLPASTSIVSAPALVRVAVPAVARAGAWIQSSPLSLVDPWWQVGQRPVHSAPASLSWSMPPPPPPPLPPVQQIHPTSTGLSSLPPTTSLLYPMTLSSIVPQQALPYLMSPLAPQPVAAAPTTALPTLALQPHAAAMTLGAAASQPLLPIPFPAGTSLSWSSSPTLPLLLVHQQQQQQQMQQNQQVMVTAPLPRTSPVCALVLHQLAQQQGQLQQRRQQLELQLEVLQQQQQQHQAVVQASELRPWRLLQLATPASAPTFHSPVAAAQMAADTLAYPLEGPSARTGAAVLNAPASLLGTSTAVHHCDPMTEFFRGAISSAAASPASTATSSLPSAHADFNSTHYQRALAEERDGELDPASASTRLPLIVPQVTHAPHQLRLGSNDNSRDESTAQLAVPRHPVQASATASQPTTLCRASPCSLDKTELHKSKKRRE